MLAYDYPMLDVFVTIVGIMVFVIWLYLLFQMITDVFRDPEQSGGGRAMWIIILFVLPYIGVLAYLAVHGAAMSLRMRETDVRRSNLVRY